MAENGDEEQILEIPIGGANLDAIRDMFFAFYEYGDRAFNRVFQGTIAEYRKYYFCANSPDTVEEVTILSMEPPRRGQPPRINIQDESGEKHSVHPIMLEFKRFRQ
jgi:hypothetical protein|nr:MAG TPA: hypothetical protein [Caudoviricetes sp.]